MKDFITKVAKMRELQKRYLKERDHLILRAAKAAETAVDQALIQLETKKKNEPTLF